MIITMQERIVKKKLPPQLTSTCELLPSSSAVRGLNKRQKVIMETTIQQKIKAEDKNRKVTELLYLTFFSAS